MYNAYWHWPTFLLFLLASLLSLFFLKRYDKSNVDNIRLLCLGLVPVFVLFFFRDVSVGKDLVQYGFHVDNGVLELLQFQQGSYSEPLFTLIYLISNLLGGIRPFIYITSFLEFLFIFIALRRYKSHGVDTSWIFVLFFAMVGIRSFSMVRNGVAVACSLCAYSYMLDSGKKRLLGFIAFSLLTLGFHNTAIINFLLLVLCYPTKYSVDSMNQVVFKKCALIIAFFLFVYLFGVSTISERLGSLEEGRYERLELTNNGFGIGNLLTRLPFIFIVLVYMKKTQSLYKKNLLFFILMLIVDVFISQMRYMSTDFERLALYTAMAMPILLSIFYSAYNGEDKLSLKVLYMAIFIYYLVDNLYYWGVVGEYGCMPYHFMSF